METNTLIYTDFNLQTDCQTERMHRTLAKILRALLFQDQPELVVFQDQPELVFQPRRAEKLPYVELEINSATNATT